MNRIRRIAAGAALGLAALALLAGCAPVAAKSAGPAKAPAATAAPAAKTAPAAKAPTPMGEPVESKNWRVVVEAAERTPEYRWSTYVAPEKADGEFVIVALAVTNLAKTNFGLNDHDFELRDAEGRTYNPKSFSGGFITYLKEQGRKPLGGQVPPDTAFATGLLFDISPGATGLTLRVKQANADVALG